MEPLEQVGNLSPAAQLSLTASHLTVTIRSSSLLLELCFDFYGKKASLRKMNLIFPQEFLIPSRPNAGARRLRPAVAAAECFLLLLAVAILWWIFGETAAGQESTRSGAAEWGTVDPAGISPGIHGR